jgi:hypothetical protein
MGEFRRLRAVALAIGFALSAAANAHAAERACRNEPGGAGVALDRARAFTQTLTPEQRKAVVFPFGKASAIRWSNLPVALAPRIGLRMGDMTPAQNAAAERLLRTALSSCGVDLLADIRAADGVLMPQDTRKIGWNPGNYFMAFIGEPSPTQPWILQVGGHHIAYNIAFNSARVSATPLFDGVEPVTFIVDGRERAPLAFQADAMRALAVSVSSLGAAKLDGQFRDVTRGATPAGDTDFPMTYPSGQTGRGAPYPSLTGSQRAAVTNAIRAWVDLPNGAISRGLLADYTSAAALAQTFVGVAGSADLSTPGSYVRIDGPRLWVEFVVQPAVADPKAVHYHTIWRDKIADYGGAFSH